ncbi:MAG: hypothetical protein HQ588_02965 [Deltaproteobacteria bacterium]|nr:hypothetical protein [Deltaproteobacteria bacterium]
MRRGYKAIKKARAMMANSNIALIKEILFKKRHSQTEIPTILALTHLRGKVTIPTPPVSKQNFFFPYPPTQKGLASFHLFNPTPHFNSSLSSHPDPPYSGVAPPLTLLSGRKKKVLEA